MDYEAMREREERLRQALKVSIAKESESDNGHH